MTDAMLWSIFWTVARVLSGVLVGHYIIKVWEKR